MEVYGVVYLIVNMVNGKRYVGQTIQPLAKRFNAHAYADSLIGKAIRKYGKENFRCGVIKTCTSKAELNAAEKHFIAALNCKAPYGYNLTDGGEGIAGLKRSSETRSKISIAKRGYSPYKNLITELDAHKFSYHHLAALLNLSQTSV